MKRFEIILLSLFTLQVCIKYFHSLLSNFPKLISIISNNITDEKNAFFFFLGFSSM